MKNSNGIGIISLIIIIVIFAIIIGIGVNFGLQKYKEAQIKTLQTDMLLVEWKVKSYIDNQKAEGKTEIIHLGTKVSDLKENIIIKDFLSKNVIPESEYDKYYVLNDEDMKNAGLEITNYEDSYYLINYETYDVIITKGCEMISGEILYKLSDIENREQEENIIANEELNVEAVDEQ